MAQVDIGKIKIVWKGPWNSGTAYTVDDAVSHSGSSYICIQAGTNQNPSSATAYWQVMATAGTDGTDVGATLANKEIAFKTNAGAVDGIPIGTAGQFLKVNSGATGYEFGTPAGIISSHHNVQTGTTAHSSATYTDNYAPRVTLTPASTSSKFLIIATGSMFNQRANYFSALTLYKDITGGASTNLATSSGSGDMVHVRTYSSNEVYAPFAITYIDAPNTTSELKYQVRYRAETSSDTARINNNNTQSQMTVIEF